MAHGNPRTQKDPTRVLFIAAEADPLIKVGGLGDVAGSLPAALRALASTRKSSGQIDVRLVIPFYSGIDRSKFDLRQVASFAVQHEPTPLAAEVYQTQVGDLPVYLIAGEPIPTTGPVYSLEASQDIPKFTFFSLAALELARQIDWQPHILHANDWHTALAVYALSLLRPEDAFFENTHSVLTLHNLPFMGAPLDQAFHDFGLPPAMDGCLPDWARRLPLPLGLLSADRIVAVSPHYAQEILTPAFGCGLEEFLTDNRERLMGIINGIDVQAWDPATDPHIVFRFDADRLDERVQNKLALLEQIGLNPDPEIPLIGLISRMDPQKGIDLVPESLWMCAGQPWQAVLLGTGTPILEQSIRGLEEELPGQVRSLIRFDEILAHRIYAGVDLLLMPSRYEPCGLAQMIAMRYGCVPLARSTGGLFDTISDVPDPAQQTGFLFEETTSLALSETIKRGLTVYNDRTAWRLIQNNGMKQNFSWEKSAAAYAKLYTQLRN